VAHQVNSIDYGDYRYKVGDLIKISSSHEYLYLATTGSSRTNCPNISKDTRKITQIWESDSNSSISNPIITAYHSGSYRYGGGAIRPEQIAIGSGGQKIKSYVYYNANGGSGAPGTQTKMYGSVLTLSTIRPTRAGYMFVAWNTNQDGTGANYSPGQSYNVDANLTLYAIWRLHSYTVTYDANGGSGAPGTQTKIHDEILSISNIVPSRTGYTFQGWSTTRNGAVVYKPSAQYIANQDITLYAVWKANGYSITYNANGGSSAPSEQVKTHDIDITLSTQKPVRKNYSFLGWGTSSSSTSVAYNPGDVYRTNANLILYAIWQLAYTEPRITNFTVERCDVNGKLKDDGTYAKVVFNWETDKTVTSIKIEHKLPTQSVWTSITVSASGTKGIVNKIIGGNFSIETTYNLRVTVSDSNGENSELSDIPYLNYIMDILNTGNGVSFGKPAEVENVADINYALRLQKGLEMVARGRIRTPIILVEGNTNGDGLKIGGGQGLVIIGSGNSVDNYFDGASLTGDMKKTYVTGDDIVSIVTGMQGGYANRKEYEFNASGDFKVPGNIYSNNQKVLTESSLSLGPELLWSGENETGKDIIINSPVEEYTKLIFVYKRNDGFFYNATFLVSTLLKTTEASGVQQMLNTGTDTTVYVFPKDHKKIRVWMTSNLKVLELYGQKY
jgi:uncharacterized repeat protein (TIGR02543 family)